MGKKDRSANCTDNATGAAGWKRRALKLVRLCLQTDTTHVLRRAMRRWPLQALLEATEGWEPSQLAELVSEWEVDKVRSRSNACQPMPASPPKQFTVCQTSSTDKHSSCNVAPRAEARPCCQLVGVPGATEGTLGASAHAQHHLAPKSLVPCDHMSTCNTVNPTHQDSTGV